MQKRVKFIVSIIIYIYDMPFIMGHGEDELSLVISIKILSTVVRESF
jgi:hypothetical protein